MVLAILYALWKIRKHCSCPGLNKKERKQKKQMKWNKRQLQEIETKISRYEKKLEDILSLRESLDLTSSMGTNPAEQNS